MSLGGCWFYMMCFDWTIYEQKAEWYCSSHFWHLKLSAMCSANHVDMIKAILASSDVSWSDLNERVEPTWQSWRFRACFDQWGAIATRAQDEPDKVLECPSSRDIKVGESEQWFKVLTGDTKTERHAMIQFVQFVALCWHVHCIMSR